MKIDSPTFIPTPQHLAELSRLGDAGSAWRSTRAVLVGVGFGVLIEFAAGLLAVLVWVAGVLAT